MTCAAVFCAHCAETADGDECRGCGDSTVECGADEGRMCPACEAKEEKYWAGYFGLRADMTPAQRREQLERMRPPGAEGKTGAEVD